MQVSFICSFNEPHSCWAGVTRLAPVHFPGSLAGPAVLVMESKVLQQGAGTFCPCCFTVQEVEHAPDKNACFFDSVAQFSWTKKAIEREIKIHFLGSLIF